MASKNDKVKNCTEVFAERFRQLCTERGFYDKNSVQANILASELGTSASTIVRYVSGARLPDASYLALISNYFRVSVDWLLGIVDDRSATAISVYYPDPKDKDDGHKLTADESIMLDRYRRASENDKQIVGVLLAKYK